MKKVFALLAIAGFVACNNAENATPKVDTPATPEVKVDSPAAKVDSPAAKVDSPATAAPAAPAAH
ncbi:MAG: hypothetical protein ACOVMM_12010 [Chitinophagaceae bacterium]